MDSRKLHTAQLERSSYDNLMSRKWSETLDWQLEKSNCTKLPTVWQQFDIPTANNIYQLSLPRPSLQRTWQPPWSDNQRSEYFLVTVWNAVTTCHPSHPTAVTNDTTTDQWHPFLSADTILTSTDHNKGSMPSNLQLKRRSASRKYFSLKMLLLIRVLTDFKVENFNFSVEIIWHRWDFRQFYGSNKAPRQIQTSLSSHFSGKSPTKYFYFVRRDSGKRSKYFYESQTQTRQGSQRQVCVASDGDS